MKKQLKRLAALFLALLVCMPCLALAQEAPPQEERSVYPMLTGSLNLVSGNRYRGMGRAVFPNEDTATVKITLHKRVMDNIYHQCGSEENTGYGRVVTVTKLYDLSAGDYKLVVQAWNSTYYNSQVIDIHI